MDGRKYKERMVCSAFIVTRLHKEMRLIFEMNIIFSWRDIVSHRVFEAPGLKTMFVERLMLRQGC